MIQFQDRAPLAPAPGAPLHLFQRIRAPNPLAGPGRADDPARALRRDMEDIAAAKGGVDEEALLQRGWSIAEIIEYLPEARRLGRSDDGIDRA